MLDLGDPETYADGVPHDEFRRLRHEDPVAWQNEPTGAGFWAVTRYRDVVEVLRTPAVYSSYKGGALLADPPPQFLEKLRENMLNRDPPDHTRLKKLVSHVFSPKRVGLLERAIEAHARALVDGLAGRTECDFAADVAGRMPLFVICEILGVPDADRARLHALTWRMFGSPIEDRAAAFADGMAAANEMRAYAASLCTERIARPTGDLVSDLASAEIDGERLTPGELQAFFMLLFNAGSDTTRSLLCVGLDLLLTHPDAFARVRTDPAALEPAIEECLRYEPAVIQFRRTATRDAELGGRTIREGDKVVVFFPSANRDETVFSSPDTFDITRTPNPHLAFGHGTHFCLGAPLARMESRHVLRELFARTTTIERIAPPVQTRSNFIRSVRAQRIAYRLEPAC